MTNREMKDLLVAQAITVVLLVAVIGAVFLIKEWL